MHEYIGFSLPTVKHWTIMLMSCADAEDLQVNSLNEKLSLHSDNTDEVMSDSFASCSSLRQNVCSWH